MTRLVPIALQDALDTRNTTLTQLLRVKPVNGPAMGFCATNDDVPYNDGQGLLTYRALTGWEDSAIESASGTDVDNAEARILFAPVDSLGMTVEQVNAGYLDDAKFWVYLIDYLHPEKGHVLLHYGRLGEIRYEDSLLAIPELRSLTQIAKQKVVCEAGSKRCRAIYGNAATGCRATPTWTTGATVLGVDADEADGAFLPSVDLPAPGLAQWTSGANTGFYSEIEESDSGGVRLLHPTPYAIAEGDGFQWRVECDHTWAMCKTLLTYDVAKQAFRGEPFRPEAIGDALSAPGGST